METLPAVRSDGSVAIITSAPVPPKIIKHLTEFQPDEEQLRREMARYASLSETETTKAVKAAHDALDQGRVLIDIEQTLRPRYETFPRLAVGHLTDKKVYCRVWVGSGRVEYRNQRKGRVVFYEFEGGRDYQDSGAHPGDWRQREAVAPTLPPELAAKYNPKDSNLLVLWEATWTRETEHKWTPPPVRDPALIEHVAGSLYAVLAVWDLSPVEAAALGQKVR